MLIKWRAIAALSCILMAGSSAWAGTWQITVTPTNVESSSSSHTSAVGLSMSKSTSATLVTSAGQTSGTVTAQARAAYSGTWTFQWVPDNSTDWPAAYTIKSIKTKIYQTVIRKGSGTVKVLVTGGADLSKLDSTSAPSSVNANPTSSTSTDTSVSNLTVVTKTIADNTTRAVSTDAWMKSQVATEIKERAYTATYFTANFGSPSAVTLTFTVESIDLSADLSFSGTASDSVGAAIAAASEVYQVVP